MHTINTKFRMPKDPAERKKIWEQQLDRIAAAQHKTKLELIDLGEIDIELSLKELVTVNKNSSEFRSERSALKKMKTENRMKSLCLIEQEQKLRNAISSIVN